MELRSDCNNSIPVAGCGDNKLTARRGPAVLKARYSRAHRFGLDGSSRLLNTRHTGKTTWNTRRKVRVPGTGKRVFRPRPQNEWVTTEAPQLRIVSDELATAVHQRLEAVKSTFGGEGSGLTAGPKRYLFSGLLKCSVCGGSIALVSGRARHGADRYGCSVHH